MSLFSFRFFFLLWYQTSFQKKETFRSVLPIAIYWASDLLLCTLFLVGEKKIYLILETGTKLARMYKASEGLVGNVCTCAARGTSLSSLHTLAYYIFNRHACLLMCDIVMLENENTGDAGRLKGKEAFGKMISRLLHHRNK